MAQDSNKGTLILVDSSGDALTEDTEMPGMYNIAATGAQTKYFYIPNTGQPNKTINSIRYMLSAAATLIVKLQMKALGAANWQPLTNLSTGTLAADGTSQEINSKSLLNEYIPSGAEVRIMATTGATATIGVQVIVI